LWLAEIMMPASARIPVVSRETAGVGSGPTSWTSTPMLVMPAASPDSNM